MAEGLPPTEVGRAAAAATGRVFPPRLLGQPLRRRRRQRAQSRRSSGGGLWCAQASGLSARGDGLRAASVGAAPVRRFRRRPEQVIEEGREETASLASPRAASSRSEGRSTAAGELSGAFSSAWGSSGDGSGGGDAAFGDAAGDGSAGGDAADGDAAGGEEGGGGVGPSCRGAAGGAPGASGSDGRSHGTSYAGTHASVPSLKTHDSWCSAPSREQEGSAHNTRAARPRGPTARALDGRRGERVGGDRTDGLLAAVDVEPVAVWPRRLLEHLRALDGGVGDRRAASPSGAARPPGRARACCVSSADASSASCASFTCSRNRLAVVTAAAAAARTSSRWRKSPLAPSCRRRRSTP